MNVVVAFVKGRKFRRKKKIRKETRRVRERERENRENATATGICVLLVDRR